MQDNTAAPSNAPTGATVPVAVIGSGMSGLAMARRCQEMGLDFVVLEKADEVGGTWRDNTYPGLYVDIPSQDYHLAFWPKHDWKRAFAAGPELQDYLVDLSVGTGIRDHIVFGVEVVDATWAGDAWTLTSADGRVFRAEVVVAATGFLHHPKIPAIPGLEEFAGPAFHSSQWPEGLDVTGKKVAVVGTGSSGIQITTALGLAGVDVVQVVRTPQWIEICENPELSPEDMERAAADPTEGRVIVQRLRERIGQDERLRDPAWKLAPGELREAAQQALREDLEQIRDPELRALLTPDFPPGCKRIPKSQQYFEVVQRDNVRVVRGGVVEVRPHSVVVDNGDEIEVDVLVLATGFRTHAYVRPMNVTGAGGLSLDEVWEDGPYSYRGVSVPGFPNFFLMHGPFSPVNNVPVPWTIQHETDYICALLGRVRDERVSLAPSETATDRFMSLVEMALPGTVWALDCDNWYKAGGRAIVWPWFEKEHRQMFDNVASEELVVAPLAPAVV